MGDDAILRAHCEAVGRDHREIERTVSVDVVIRDDRDAAMAVYRGRLAASGEDYDPEWPHFVGAPAEIADALRPYARAGFAHFLVEAPAPYDLETIDRIGEVLEHLRA